jgi:hypothetical protein
MDKIVILTDSLKKSGRLVSVLRTLFPACEIQMQLVKGERRGDVSGKPARDTAGNKIKSTINDRRY